MKVGDIYEDSGGTKRTIVKISENEITYSWDFECITGILTSRTTSNFINVVVEDAVKVTPKEYKIRKLR